MKIKKLLIILTCLVVSPAQGMFSLELPPEMEGLESPGEHTPYDPYDPSAPVTVLPPLPPEQTPAYASEKEAQAKEAEAAAQEKTKEQIVQEQTEEEMED